MSSLDPQTTLEGETLSMSTVEEESEAEREEVTAKVIGQAHGRLRTFHRVCGHPSSLPQPHCLRATLGHSRVHVPAGEGGPGGWAGHSGPLQRTARLDSVWTQLKVSLLV